MKGFLSPPQVLRRWLTVPGASRELRQQARLEGLASGSLKLGPGLITVALTAIATDVGSSPGKVQLALGAFAAVGAAAVLRTTWRLRRRSEERPRPRLVLWSFLLMGIALAGVAVAPNVWVLALALALLGAAGATNARYRYDAMARFPEAPSAFQTISRRWSQVIATLGLVVLGALVASPVGWDGAAAATSAWLVVLGCWIYRARARRGPARVASTAEQPALGRLLKLHSVRRFLLVVVLATAIGRAGQSHLEPMLADDLGRFSSAWASVLIAGSQLLMMGAIARINQRAERSPRQEARRSTLWMAVAAIVAAGAAASPWPWLTVLTAFAWMLLAELVAGGTSQTTRLGLQRSGQLTSLLGTAVSSMGNALGAMIAALPIMSHAAGIGLVLLAGAGLCAGAASWRRRRASRERATTTAREIMIGLRPIGEREIAVTVTEPSGRQTLLPLYDGDALAADTQFDARTNGERIPLLQIPLWRGPSWTPHALLARLPRRRRTLRGLWPRTALPFVAHDLSGTINWTGAGELGYELKPHKNGVDVLVRLPHDERFPVTWFPLRSRDLSELPADPT